MASEHLSSVSACAAEIIALSGVYDDLVSGSTHSDDDAHMKKLQSQYAKERILKLSFHLKKRLEAVQRGV